MRKSSADRFDALLTVPRTPGSIGIHAFSIYEIYAQFGWNNVKTMVYIEYG